MKGQILNYFIMLRSPDNNPFLNPKGNRSTKEYSLHESAHFRTAWK